MPIPVAVFVFIALFFLGARPNAVYASDYVIPLLLEPACIREYPPPAIQSPPAAWAGRVQIRPTPNPNCYESSNHKLSVGGTSLKVAEKLIDARIHAASSPYKMLQRNWVTRPGRDISLANAVREVVARYAVTVESRIPEPRIEHIATEYGDLVYPANFDGNADEVKVSTQRITISISSGVRTNDVRKMILYFLNENKDTKGHLVVLFNGHIGPLPARQMIGTAGDGSWGVVAGRLAVRGYKVLIFDDRQALGESESTSKEGRNQPLGLIRELADLRAIDTAELTPRAPWKNSTNIVVSMDHVDHPYRRIDLVGLSGGTERLFHFLMLTRSTAINSVYLAGGPQSPWMALDNTTCSKDGFGYDQDTFDFPFLSSFQWADLLLPAAQRGVKIRLAMNKREPGLLKYINLREIAPTLKRFGVPFSIGGDDPQGKGGDDGLCHEFDFKDLLKFLEGPSPGRPAGRLGTRG